jgi:hypothetical protein
VVGLAEAEPLVADMVSLAYPSLALNIITVTLSLSATATATSTLLQVGDPDWGEYWDLCLGRTLERDWSKESYSEEGNNCFSFVLTLLLQLNQHPFTGWASSKVSFCQKVGWGGVEVE